MATFVLEAFGTDQRFGDDTRYRRYTRSPTIAALFRTVPKIPFTDSGHGIVFTSRELKPGAKRLLEMRPHSIEEHINAHFAALPAQQS